MQNKMGFLKGEQCLEFKSGGCGENVLEFQIWSRIREKFPEESGIRPIVIGLAGDRFIHFPNQKDGYSLFYARNPKWNGELYRTPQLAIGLRVGPGGNYLIRIKNQDSGSKDGWLARYVF